MTSEGQIDWGGDTFPGGWEGIGSEGKSVGFEWGGDWTKPDLPHFQNTEGKGITETPEQRKDLEELRK